MKLSEFLSEQSLTDEAFAGLVGMSQSQISRLKRGLSKPSWESLAAIERATSGRVRAEDFIEGLAGHPAASGPRPDAASLGASGRDAIREAAQ